MIDVAATLRDFQRVLSQRLIAPRLCSLHSDLYLLQDVAAGSLRLTYARIVAGKAQGLVSFIPVESVETIPCFHVGYAVDPQHRRKGIGGLILQAALIELQNGLRRHADHDYYVEAVVGKENLPSNKIAIRHISETPKPIVCQGSGEDAFQYLRLFTRHKP